MVSIGKYFAVKTAAWLRELDRFFFRELHISDGIVLFNGIRHGERHNQAVDCLAQTVGTVPVNPPGSEILFFRSGQVYEVFVAEDCDGNANLFEKTIRHFEELGFYK